MRKRDSGAVLPWSLFLLSLMLMIHYTIHLMNQSHWIIYKKQRMMWHYLDEADNAFEAICQNLSVSNKIDLTRTLRQKHQDIMVKYWVKKLSVSSQPTAVHLQVQGIAVSDDQLFLQRYSTVLMLPARIEREPQDHKER